MWNEEPIDECTRALCEIKVCRYEIEKLQPSGGVAVCKSYHWAAWAEWTQCDIQWVGVWPHNSSFNLCFSCGEEGKRKRFRKCINSCTGEKSDDKECKPFNDPRYDKPLTNEDWTRCSPCPEEEIASWAEWGQWALVGSYKMFCGKGESHVCSQTYNNNNNNFFLDVKMKHERKRTCLGGEKGEKK